MKRTFLFTVILISLIYNLSAQTIMFNEIYHFGPEVDQEVARSIIETEFGYIIAGDVYSYSIPYIGNKLFLFETDKEGKLRWSIQYHNDKYYRFSSECDLFRVNDSIYDWFIVQTDTSNHIRRPLLIRFNDKGQIVFSKVLYDPEFTDSASLTPIKAYKTMDNGYLLVCNVFPYASRLLKYNADLELEWEREISSNNDFVNVSSIIEMNDGTYYLSYSRSNNNARMTRFARLDALGNIFWSTTVFNNDNTRGIYELTVLEDSTLLSVGTQGGKFQVSKFTMNGQIIWSKSIGDIVYYPTVLGLFRAEDGTFQFFGSTAINDCGYIFKISKDADSIYYRSGIIHNSIDIHMARVNNGILANDGNLVLCGSVTLADPGHDWPDRAWVVKTDWYGCDIPGCDSTGVTILNHTPSQNICSGDHSYFEVNTIGNQLQFEWQVYDDTIWTPLQDNESYSGCQQDTLRINNTLLINGNRLFRCKIWNDWYERFTPEISLIYLSAPEIIQQPTSQYVQEGGNALLSIIATGIELPVYQWFFNGNPIPGGNLPEFDISPVTSADTGMYQCRIWNYCGEKISIPVIVTSRPNSIEETAESGKMMIFPNPIKDVFSITNTSGNVTAEIIDLTGRTVHMSSSSDNTFRIPANIPNGVYILRLNTEKSIAFQKVVLSRR